MFALVGVGSSIAFKLVGVSTFGIEPPSKTVHFISFIRSNILQGKFHCHEQAETDLKLKSFLTGYYGSTHIRTNSRVKAGGKQVQHVPHVHSVSSIKDARYH